MRKVLEKTPVIWRKDVSCVGVVMASEGYPEKPRMGYRIYGLREVSFTPNVLVFHGGTKEVRDGGKAWIETAGGRVLTVVGGGKSLSIARDRAYSTAKLIKFEGAIQRSDIAS